MRRGEKSYLSGIVWGRWEVENDKFIFLGWFWVEWVNDVQILQIDEDVY